MLESPDNLWKFLFFACVEKQEFPIFFCDGKFPWSSRILWANTTVFDLYNIPQDYFATNHLLIDFIDFPQSIEFSQYQVKLNIVINIEKKYYNSVVEVNFFGEYHIVEVFIDYNKDVDTFYDISSALKFTVLGKIVWTYVSGQIVKYTNSLTPVFEDLTQPAYISSFLIEPDNLVLNSKLANQKPGKPFYTKCLISYPKQSLTSIGRFNRIGPYVYADIVLIEAGVLTDKGLIKACSIIPGIFALIKFEIPTSRYSFVYVNPRFVNSFFKSSSKEIESQQPEVFFSRVNNYTILPFLEDAINKSEDYKSSLDVNFLIKDKPVDYLLEIAKFSEADKQIIFVLSFVEKIAKSSENNAIFKVTKLLESIDPSVQKMLTKTTLGIIVLFLGYIIFGAELKTVIIDIIKAIIK